ncbi:putative ABC transport system permease protein [Caldanaerobius fijiensis DSM 17918]|uniref:Putative ABC transport system permease protein n=1 Tax=Caldanaerobius fijiensis DSM 17918 TaxID=1121256 RepID=A0A1M5DMK7_9THEO|nr:iron export ABC transporter permease subunit FetB [Caldanaerobius fijiensis]SHF68125.1 putative ABC transport system permease protein [Caldanaerobius fijiensis DSM 17918]
MNVWPLTFASSLVFIAMFISYYQKLAIEKEIIVGTVRAVIQLTIVGYILHYIFAANNYLFTLAMICVMILVAGNNAAKRGKGIPGVFYYITVSIAIAATITLAILVFFKAIHFVPQEVIPVSGMIIGNSMVSSGLTVSRLKDEIKGRALEIQTALALGATARQSVQKILKIAIKTGMMPTIDGMKTLGIVQLPGMMTGLILGGVDPINAVKYQIMVTFMLASTVAISCFSVAFLTYRRFFTAHHQLVQS